MKNIILLHFFIFTSFVLANESIQISWDDDPNDPATESPWATIVSDEAESTTSFTAKLEIGSSGRNENHQGYEKVVWTVNINDDDDIDLLDPVSKETFGSIDNHVIQFEIFDDAEGTFEIEVKAKIYEITDADEIGEDERGRNTYSVTGTAILTISKIDLLQVPDYLFAAAEYWTPIKFKVHPDSVPVTASSFTSLKATLHYDDASGAAQMKEISGLESYVEAVTGVNTFECYIDPANYAAISIANKHYSDKAYFTLEADLGTVTCSSDSSDAEGAISKKFVDKNIYAVDMTDANTSKTIQRATDARPFSSTDPVKRWEGVSYPLLWGIDQGPIVICAFSYSIWKDESYDATGTFGSSPANPYWDDPKFPRWQHTDQTGILFNQYQSDCFNTASFEAESSFGATLTYSGSLYPSLYSETRMKQKGDNIFRGTYVGKNFGLRNGAYYFISYGGKDPSVLPSGKRAIDLGKTQAKGILKVFNGYAEVSVKTPGAIDGGMTLATLNLGWALGAPIPYLSQICGTAASIYPLISPTNTASSGKAYTKIRSWEMFSVEGDTSKRWAPGDGDMFMRDSIVPINNDGSPESDPMIVMAEYPDSDPKAVGTMVAAFVELNTTAQLIAKDTAALGSVHEGVSSAKYGTSASDRDDIEIRCVYEP